MYVYIYIYLKRERESPYLDLSSWLVGFSSLHFWRCCSPITRNIFSSLCPLVFFFIIGHMLIYLFKQCHVNSNCFSGCVVASKAALYVLAKHSRLLELETKLYMNVLTQTLVRVTGTKLLNERQSTACGSKRYIPSPLINFAVRIFLCDRRLRFLLWKGPLWSSKQNRPWFGEES